MLDLTDEEREQRLKSVYPNIKRYTIDFKNDFTDWWDLYDMPVLAMKYLSVLCNSPDKPKDMNKWKHEHWVGTETNTRWDFIREQE